MIFYYTPRLVVIQLSSEKLPPAAIRNRCRDPKPLLPKERVLGTYSYKWDISLKSFPSEFREYGGRGGRNSIRVPRDGGHQVYRTLWINYQKLIWTHREWSMKKRSYTFLYQFLCVYIVAFSLVFSWDFWVCLWVDLWLLCLLLGFFSICCAVSM